MRVCLVAVALLGGARPAAARSDGGVATEVGAAKTASPEPAVREPNVRIEREGPSAQERLQKRLEEDAAAARMRNARVHPRLNDIRRTAQQTFDPTWDLAEDHPRDIGSVGSTVGQAGKSVLRSWMRQAPRFAKNAPMPQPARNPATVRPEEEDEPTMLEQYDAQLRGAVDEANSLTAIACVELAPGKEPTAQVTRTSGRGRFDRVVRASVLAAARARPVPADLEPARVCYRFTAHFATMPPVPYASCSLEESERTKQRCVWPLRRLISRDVDLISVE